MIDPGKVEVLLKLTPVQRGYLKQLTEEAAARPCHRSNCDTVCKCLRCMARDLLPAIQQAVAASRGDVFAKRENRNGVLS